MTCVAIVMPFIEDGLRLCPLRWTLTVVCCRTHDGVVVVVVSGCDDGGVVVGCWCCIVGTLFDCRAIILAVLSTNFGLWVTSDSTLSSSSESWLSRLCFKSTLSIGLAILFLFSLWFFFCKFPQLVWINFNFVRDSLKKITLTTTHKQP